MIRPVILSEAKNLPFQLRFFGPLRYAQGFGNYFAPSE